MIRLGMHFFFFFQTLRLTVLLSVFLWTFLTCLVLWLPYLFNDYWKILEESDCQWVLFGWGTLSIWLCYEECAVEFPPVFVVYSSCCLSVWIILILGLYVVQITVSGSFSSKTVGMSSGSWLPSPWFQKHLDLWAQKHLEIWFQKHLDLWVRKYKSLWFQKLSSLWFQKHLNLWFQKQLDHWFKIIEIHC